MAGVWVFNNGIIRLVENAGAEHGIGGGGGRRKVLVHVPSNEVVTSYAVLEEKLATLGWERYFQSSSSSSSSWELIQFHKRSTDHLISVPRDFSKFRSVHMYDIVVKSRNVFEVRVV